MSFCTLFQEWQATEEATRVRKSFENVFLVPMPAAPAEITVQLYDFHENVAAKLTHPVDPKDILIRPVGGKPQTRMLLDNGDSKDKIDIAILAEGYTEGEMDIFFKDAESTVENLLRHEPFKSMKDRFNIVAVASPSEDSGVSVPREGLWKKDGRGLALRHVLFRPLPHDPAPVQDARRACRNPLRAHHNPRQH